MMKIISSEQVGKGHPDKIADQISDIVLQMILINDNNAHVACETMITRNEVFIRGEVAANFSFLDLQPQIEAKIITFLKALNYKFTNQTQDFIINLRLDEQSPEINLAVSKSDNDKNLGAGDQGIIYGYATNETSHFLPLPYVLATEILMTLDNSPLKAPNFDSKSQVTFDYDSKEITTFLVSIQHQEGIDTKIHYQKVEQEILKLVKKYHLNDDFKILVNPSGSFTVGGPKSDIGLTGRKIVADSYGGFAKHGGGAFSGKDATKVDRSAAYMLRHIAKNIVYYGMADEIEIQISYAIGKKDPISININTFDTNNKSEEYIINFISNNFDLTPYGIKKYLKLDDLKLINYIDTASYGHFINKDYIFPWEQIIDQKDLIF